MTDTIDNAVQGYSFFEPETGVARYIRPRYIEFRKAWETAPTVNDISGIDKSSVPMPKIKFDLSAPEDMHRATIIQYGYNTLGANLAPMINDLPDDYIRQHLFNIAYDRPMNIDAIRLRVGDSLNINPYAAAPYFFTMYLLRTLADQLMGTSSNTFKAQGQQLINLADHIRFALDRILVNYNLTDLPDNVLLDALEVVQKDSDIVIAKNHTLYVAKERYEPWVAKGGDEVLMVAEWGLNGKQPDDTTIANKATIMAAWAAAQTPAN